ncbi:MAG: 50S ribosomal protein L31e [Candidatus Bathyarchaeia archaeon]
MEKEVNETETEEAREQVEKTEEAEEEPLEVKEAAEETLEEEAEKGEEAKPKPEEEVEEEIVEERFYTISLGKAWLMPPNKRAPKAMRIIKDFVKRHMKLEAREEGDEESEPRRLIVSNEVNEKVWSRGIEKPPRKIRIRAAKDKDGNVTVYLAEGD